MFMNSFFKSQPMGMNFRNYLIRELNSQGTLQRAKYKAGFKRVLRQAGIPTPQTYEEIHDFSDMNLISSFPDEFVIKPSRGYGGSGIILLKRDKNVFVNPAGDVYTYRDLRAHVRKILDGEYSGYIARDTAIIEERIYPSEKLRFKDAYGLPDIRIWCLEFVPVMSMLRYPTFLSKGKANLAAGGIGVGIDLASGRLTNIHLKSSLKEPKKEDLEIPQGFTMPKWDEMKAMAVKCARLANLGITGVDLLLDIDDRVQVLEVNGRPGLEIQNINEDSLLKAIEA